MLNITLTGSQTIISIIFDVRFKILGHRSLNTILILMDHTFTHFKALYHSLSLFGCNSALRLYMLQCMVQERYRLHVRAVHVDFKTSFLKNLNVEYTPINCNVFCTNQLQRVLRGGPVVSVLDRQL